MTAQLSYKIDGKKFLWDSVTYDSREAAQEAMKAYVQEGFEVELLEIEGQFLLYSRRVAAEQSAS